MFGSKYALNIFHLIDDANFTYLYITKTEFRVIK